MSSTTGSASRRSARYGALAGLTQQILSVVVTIVLARLLLPSDFGLVVIAQSAVAGVALIANIGLGASVVRTSTLDRLSASTFLWAALALGGLLTAGTLLSAGTLASALGQPQAEDLVRLLAPVLALQVVGAIPRAVLQRARRLHVVYAIETVGFLVYAFAQVALAVSGFGPRSVVLGQLLMAVVVTGGLVIAAPARPSLCFSLALLRKEVGFSAQVVALSGVNYVGKNVDYWALSRLLGASALGLYYIAYVLPNILRQRLSGLVSDVAFPVLAGLQHDLPGVRAVYDRSVRMLLVIAVPPMVGLAALAEPTILVFFGPEWAGAAPAMALLSVAAAAEVTVPITGVVFMALGVPLRSAVLQAGRVVVLVAALAGGLAVSRTLEMAAAAVLVTTMLFSAAAHLQVASLIGRSGSARGGLFRALFVPSGVMAAAVTGWARASSDYPPVVGLVTGVALGVVVYAVAGFGLGGAAFRADAAEIRRLVTPGPG